MSHLILGGAAVHRCGNWLALRVGLAAEVSLRREKYFFRSLLGLTLPEGHQHPD
jgi:hypothetical protein